MIGMSGGATLGLALASRGVELAGAVLHEPAVGSLAPTLLAPMAAAFTEGGTARFARALYGLSWRPEAVGGPADWLEDEVTGRELAMFRSFEPSPASPAAGRVVVTFGTNSPAIRRDAAEALTAAHGHEVRPIPGVGHFAPYDAPEIFARAVREVVVGA